MSSRAQSSSTDYRLESGPVVASRGTGPTMPRDPTAMADVRSPLAGGLSLHRRCMSIDACPQRPSAQRPADACRSPGRWPPWPLETSRGPAPLSVPVFQHTYVHGVCNRSCWI